MENMTYAGNPPIIYSMVDEEEFPSNEMEYIEFVCTFRSYG